VKAENPRALIRYALVGLVVTVALTWAVYLVRDALLLIYISALTAIGLSPFAQAAEERTAAWRYRLPRWAAVLVVYLSIVAILVGVGLLIIPPLVEQAQALTTAAPVLIDTALQRLKDFGVLSPETSVGDAIRSAPKPGSDAVGTVLGAVWGFIGGIFGAVTILILSFYMLVDGQGIVRAFVRAFPRSERPRVVDACLRVTIKVSAWLNGQLLLAAIIGTTAAIGLWLLGVPYFYVLALIAAIGEMIPVVGPLLAAIPAVAVALSVSPALALAVAVFFFLQQQLENHVLVPKVMSRQVGVSPVVVIMSLLIGGSLLGVVGAILAVPTAAILQVVVEELAADNSAAPDVEHAGQYK
jgi:predicted PurR-regulated permease PerM